MSYGYSRAWLCRRDGRSKTHRKAAKTWAVTACELEIGDGWQRGPEVQTTMLCGDCFEPESRFFDPTVFDKMRADYQERHGW